MDFYNDGSIEVTDTTFITPNGDQYPIRNITSVQVREKNYWILLILGLVFLMPGLIGLTVNFYDGQQINGSIPLILMGLVLIVWWYFSREYILWIGSGGVIQKSLSFSKRNLKDLERIINIAKAINLSIANLQSIK